MAAGGGGARLIIAGREREATRQQRPAIQLGAHHGVAFEGFVTEARKRSLMASA